MFRACRLVAPLVLIAMLALPSCTAVQQLAALRTVTFAFAGVSDVRLVGIRIGANSSSASLGLADAARISAAIIAKEMPLELVAFVSATNPRENKVTARMVDMRWKFFIEDHQVLAGQLGSPIEIAPGRTADVPLAVRVDLLQLGAGGAHDFFDLALAIAGQGTIKKDLRLELVPTIETSIGPIRYPEPIVVRRLAGGQ
jgi:hypothetical protein